ncbi:hypothetical protein ZIOFF_034746 [Zingiber officinale]|uniref:HHO5-like N-terminal domain-containing protein n=1 Tax=Zingiber officinale TaxID=94328 RepID=A0A8J5L263_ZINOF|nr:hypothetical protein ZIOFF_034746 [Zingiber officinale]
MGSELELYAMRPVAVGFVKKAVTESKERGRQVSRLEESIKSLEEEKRKIEAFKRELPLCIRLVCEGRSDAPPFLIEELKREIDRFRAEGFGRKSVCDSRNGGDASLPVFELYSSKAEDESAAVLSDLSLCSTAITHGFVTPAINNHLVSCRKCTKESPEASLVAAPGTHCGLHSQQKQPRKMRRCWSQDLHRRFVVLMVRPQLNQLLGG